MATLGHPSINGSTRLVGILGDPVEHSLSPALHNAAFAQLGLNMAYVPLPVAPPRLAEAVAGLRALRFAGANVTVPHKTAIVPLLDELRGDAQVLQAVNTVIAEGERLIGYNTDVQGFVGGLNDEVPGYRGRGTALIFGAGGAARAAAFGAVRLGFSNLVIVNRTPAAAEQLAALVCGTAGAEAAPGAVQAVAPRGVAHGGASAGAPEGAADQGVVVRCTVVPLHQLGAAQVRAASLVVNATTLGMSGQSKVPAALADNVGVDQIVYDLVYTEGSTDLARRARSKGARVVGGLSMLVHQAAAAFQLFTGVPAPLETMKRVVTR